MTQSGGGAVTQSLRNAGPYVRLLITPPPRQTSPSYSTADCPGVTAHCGSLKSRWNPALVAAVSAQGASAWR